MVSTTVSASVGASYGDEIPVKSGISPARRGVQALAVAPLALLQRGRDVNEDEPPPHRGSSAHLLAGASNGAIGEQMATPP